MKRWFNNEITGQQSATKLLWGRISRLACRLIKSNIHPKQSVTKIFKYSNIFKSSPYWSAKRHQIIVRLDFKPSLLCNQIKYLSKAECDEYIRIFKYSNIFYTNIFGYSFVSFSWYKYIRIFVRIRIILC